MSLLVPGPAKADPGDVDAIYGVNGFAFVPEGTNRAYGQSVAIQSDGKIVVAGGLFQPPASFNFIVARFNVRGGEDPNHLEDRLDHTFGSGGTVTTAFDAVSGVVKVAIQPDGKIVAAGTTTASFSHSAPVSLVLARYTANGVLDPTFGSGGKVTVPLGVGGFVSGMVIQSGGQIIVAGSVVRTGTGSDFLLVRFGSTGALDTSFGATRFPNLTGSVTTDFGGQEQAMAVALQADGKIVAAGYSQVAGQSVFAIARYSANGFLDSTFGGLGRVTTNFVNENGSFGGGNGFAETLGDTALAIAFQADGKMVVVGKAAPWRLAVDCGMLAGTPDGVSSERDSTCLDRS